MKFLFFALLIFGSFKSFADQANPRCKDSADWMKPETDLAKDSQWISIVDIIAVTGKDSYSYRVIKNIKGQNPNKEMGLVRFDCAPYTQPEKGKRYILFSIVNNPKSIQLDSGEEEEAVKKFADCPKGDFNCSTFFGLVGGTKQAWAKNNFSVTLGGVDEQYEGAIDRDAVRRVMKSIKGQFDSCTHFAAKNDLDGKVVVQFEINQDGRAKSIRIKKTELNEAALESCFVDRIRFVRFPKPGADIAIIEYPIHIQQSKTGENKK